MWDTWLCYYQETYYLYYLTMGPTEKQGMHGQGVAMSTSQDGVHWDEKGVVLLKDEGATGLGTGSVWKSEDFEHSGKFVMNYSTWFDWCIQSQHICFAESTDLIHWEKLGSDYAFHANPQWYETYPDFGDARWDCIYTIPRPGGGRYGYWTANPKGRAGFGFGETLDGRRWAALEPPVVEGTSQGECGAVEKIGDAYYMLYHGGRQTLVADRPQGPFRLAARNPELLNARSAYFTRFFPAPDGLLVNHHSMSLVGIPEGESAYQWANRQGLVWFAPLKRAVVDDQGTLRLRYWEGNDRLKGKSREPEFLDQPSSSGSRVRMLSDHVDVERGIILEGILAIPSGDSPPSGLYIETGGDRGVAILVGAAGVTEFGSVDADGSGFDADDRVDRAMVPGRTSHFRLLLRDALLEFYLDDTLIQCYSAPRVPTGRLGVIVGSPLSLTDLRVWDMDI
jgi:hypothetical protein